MFDSKIRNKINSIVLSKFFDLRRIYDVFLLKIALSFATIKSNSNSLFLFNFFKEKVSRLTNSALCLAFFVKLRKDVANLH